MSASTRWPARLPRGSGVAAHLLDEQPEQARTALLAIKQASKDALWAR